MHLEDKVYLAGNIFTLADILMYYGLHHIMVSITCIIFIHITIIIVIYLKGNFTVVEVDLLN